VFLVEMGSKTSFLGKNPFALIFYPPRWWPEYGLADDTLSATADDMER